jgi:hypothetical protein
VQLIYFLIKGAKRHMKLFRLAGLIFGAILALSLVAVAVASAAPDPEFLGSVKQTFKITSGVGVLESLENHIECASDEGSGAVEGASKVGQVVVTFLNCVAKEGTKAACTAKTEGGTTGVIVTKTLDGELGLTTESKTGVAELLLPTSGGIFATILASCLSPELVSVEGQIAGEATPVGVSSTTGGLVFGGSEGKQSIKKINILGGGLQTVKQLKAFGALAVNEKTVETLAFAGKIEVM